jgi:hypothetical protein
LVLDAGPDFFGLRLLTPLRPICCSFLNSLPWILQMYSILDDWLFDCFHAHPGSSTFGEAAKPVQQFGNRFFLIPKLGRDRPK